MENSKLGQPNGLEIGQKKEEMYISFSMIQTSLLLQLRPQKKQLLTSQLMMLVNGLN